MQTKLKQHLAIATGAVSAATIPMGAEAAIVDKDATHAVSVTYPASSATNSAEWDIDGDSTNDFSLKARKFVFISTFTATTYRTIRLDSNNRGGRGLVANNTTPGFFRQPGSRGTARTRPGERLLEWQWQH